ncbi:hypothetical protein D9M68_894990 [compost metagenome]
MQGRFRGFGQRLLLGSGVEDRAAVLRATVAELGVRGQRIDGRPVGFQQLGVAGLARIETHLYRLDMTAVARRDLFIAGVFQVPADVAGGGGQYAGQFVEIRFGAPEATAGEYCNSCSL